MSSVYRSELINKSVMQDEYNNKHLFLIVYSLLALFVIIKDVLRIALFGMNALSRFDLGLEIEYYMIYPLSAILLFYSIKYIRFTRSNILNIVTISGIYVFFEITQKLEGGGSLVALFYRLVMIISVYFFFQNPNISASDLKRIFLYLGVLLIIATAYLTFALNANNIVTFSYSSLTNIDRPQIGKHLLQSTEISNILANVIIIVFGLYSMSRNMFYRASVLFCLSVIVLLFVVMGAIGSYISLFFVFFMYYMKSGKKKSAQKWLLIPMLFCMVFVGVYYFGQDISYVIYEKIKGDGRNNMYGYLWESILKYGFFGVGYKNVGFTPHHNILGLWAEVGFFVMFAYLSQFMLCIYWFIRIVIRKSVFFKDENIMVAAGMFCMISLFMHLKGFVHDTWYDSSLVFFMSSMIGLCNNKNLN